MTMRSIASNRATVQSLAKRGLDIVGSILGLVLLVPLMSAIALAILYYQGRPILFCQSRPGLHGRPFKIVKFRTMRHRPGAGPDSDAERLTRLGSWLREHSLDELPTLLNVLAGQMSLVGPRPLLMEYLPLYNETQKRRHDVRPGLTGLAQISGRNEVRWERRFRLDVWYVDHWNICLDLRILARTVRVVLMRKGITEPGRVTMTRFEGSESETRSIRTSE